MLTNTENMKCLMVGAKGIGKTTFLSQYPNSKLIINKTETFKINCLNELKSKSKSFEYLDIEIDNYDITTNTLFVTNQSNLFDTTVNSEKLISVNNFNVIILCFAMDDPATFELIKLKWKFYLKNCQNTHNFILLGLKSDKFTTNTTSKSVLKQPNGFIKERSSSISSNSSTSKLHLHRMRLRTLSESDSTYAHLLQTEFKKFAKKISQFKLIQSSSIEHSNDLFKSTKNSIDSYVDLSKSICKCYMMKKTTTKNDSKLNKNKIKKIPRVLTAPISYLSTHKPRKLLEDKKTLTESVTFEKQDDKLTITKLKPDPSNLTIKKKISQLFIGLGTYLVTCGTGKSRRLLLTNNTTKNNTTNNTATIKMNMIKSKSNLIKKDKSWLLLSSEVSLNNLENDDVFLN